MDNHKALASAMQRAHSRGVKLLLTNSDTPLTRSLYADFELTTMATRRDVNLVASARRATDLVVKNY